jgi:hypothetical protein
MLKIAVSQILTSTSAIRISELISVHKPEKLITDDPKLLFTFASFVSAAATYVNLSSIKSPVAGMLLSIVYFSINATFLADALFRKEDLLIRLIFGVLLTMMLLGFMGWLFMLIYNLDVPEFSLVLFTVATLCSLTNNRMKKRNAN